MNENAKLRVAEPVGDAVLVQGFLVGFIGGHGGSPNAEFYSSLDCVADIKLDFANIGRRRGDRNMLCACSESIGYD